MGFGKVFKKVRKIVAKVDPIHQVSKQLGLPDPFGDTLYGSDKALSPAEKAQRAQESAQNEAARQADLAAQQAQQQQQQLALMQSNFQTDLRGENLATVVAGGTADMASAEADPTKRKRTSGLSTTLGLG